MPVTQDELASCIKVAQRELEGRAWPAGPVVDGRMWAIPAGDRVGPETKSFRVDLETACTWIGEVERVSGSVAAAVQFLRRLWYCGRFPGGAKFDRAIQTDTSRLLKVPTVAQSLLDGLTRTATLSIDPAATDRDVDLSHIFVLLDYAVNGDGSDASMLKLRLLDTSDSSVQGMLSWLGDLASAWIGLQTKRQRWIRANPGKTPPRGAPGVPDTEAYWLENSITDRSASSDVLGDLDAVILADEVKNGGQPIADLLYRYYTALAAPDPSAVNVANRLVLFLNRSNPKVPADISGGQVSIIADTATALQKMVTESSKCLLQAARWGNSDWWGIAKAAGEVDSDWGQWAVGEISNRFAQFLGTLAANGATAGVWPTGQPTPVNLGYAATVRGRAASVLTPSDPASTPVDVLEAIVQYYITSDDPWGQPPVSWSALSPVWLGDFTGKAARAAPSASGATDVVIDDVFPWSEIWPAVGNKAHRDLIKLDGATTRPNRVYRIEAVFPALRTMTLDLDPGLGEAVSAWKIMRRPRLVIIDGFGGRPHLTGAAASVPSAGATTAAVRIDIDAQTVAMLGGVNLGIDTILLDDDEGVPRLPFRVLSVDTTTDPAHPLLVLDRSPSLSQPTRWQIPAGIGGAGSDIAESRPPTAGTGCDHYDGLLFLVYGGQVSGVFPWTSYTSFRVTQPGGSVVPGVTSLRGNRRYDAHAYYSGNDFRNYSFAVHDVSHRFDDVAQSSADSVPGWDYYAGVVTMPGTANATAPPAENQKSHIRLHYGFPVPADGKLPTTGSAGCLVSPDFDSMRAQLIQTYQAELGLLLGDGADAALTRIQNADNHDAAKALYNDKVNPVTDAQWNDKVVAELFVIHPDERSSEPVSALTPWRDK